MGDSLRLTVRLAALSLLASTSCKQTGPDPGAADRASTGVSGGTVLVTVNGVPVTEEEVTVASRSGHAPGGAHATPVAADRAQQVLDTLIRRELLSQRATAMSLDQDPAYLKALAGLQAQVTDFKRRRLSELFISRQLARGAAVSEQEAQRYFNENAERIQHELHVFQILRRSRPAIDEARALLGNGTPFEAVAARGLPTPAAHSDKPWDLGFLKWTQLPLPWHRVVYNLKPGQVSGVIEGENGRFWIIKLIAKRQNPAATFETYRAVILDLLRDRKREALLQDLERQLKHNARIVTAAHR